MMKTLKASLALAAVAFALLVVPATSRAQAATKSVTCTDGSKSVGGRGACSGHGGIAAAAPAKAAAPTKAAPAPTKTAAAPTKTSAAAPTKKAAPVKAAPAPPKAAPTKAPPTAKAEGKPIAKCTDGTLSYAKVHTGACSSHGGVAEWLDGTAKKP